MFTSSESTDEERLSLLPTVDSLIKTNNNNIVFLKGKLFKIQSNLPDWTVSVFLSLNHVDFVICTVHSNFNLFKQVGSMMETVIL